MNKDVEAIFYFAKGKLTLSGYRPAHLIREDYLTTGLHEYTERLSDRKAIGTITFISPEVYPHTLWVGKRVPFFEGNCRVGYAVITKVLNPILLTDDKRQTHQIKAKGMDKTYPYTTVDELMDKQTIFFENLQDIQEQAVIANMPKGLENPKIRDYLYGATYDALYKMCEMIDGYLTDELKLALIDKESGLSLREGIELHDECSFYLEEEDPYHEITIGETKAYLVDLTRFFKDAIARTSSPEQVKTQINQSDVFSCEEKNSNNDWYEIYSISADGEKTLMGVLNKWHSLILFSGSAATVLRKHLLGMRITYIYMRDGLYYRCDSEVLRSFIKESSVSIVDDEKAHVPKEAEGRTVNSGMFKLNDFIK